MARTAWSESDQAVRAVHSCISWLGSKRMFVATAINVTLLIDVRDFNRHIMQTSVV